MTANKIKDAQARLYNLLAYSRRPLYMYGKKTGVMIDSDETRRLKKRYSKLLAWPNMINRNREIPKL